MFLIYVTKQIQLQHKQKEVRFGISRRAGAAEALFTAYALLITIEKITISSYGK